MEAEAEAALFRKVVAEVEAEVEAEAEAEAIKNCRFQTLCVI